MSLIKLANTNVVMYQVDSCIVKKDDGYYIDDILLAAPVEGTELVDSHTICPWYVPYAWTYVDGVWTIIDQERYEQGSCRSWGEALPSIQEKRNSLLTASDWVVTYCTENGLAYPNDWKAYRQELRDITNTMVDPTKLVFPDAPTTIPKLNQPVASGVQTI